MTVLKGLWLAPPAWNCKECGKKEVGNATKEITDGLCWDCYEQTDAYKERQRIWVDWSM